MKEAKLLDDLVTQWLEGDLEKVAFALAGNDKAFTVDFITLLLAERELTNHGMGSAVVVPPLSVDGWKDLARLSEMLKGL